MITKFEIYINEAKNYKNSELDKIIPINKEGVFYNSKTKKYIVRGLQKVNRGIGSTIILKSLAQYSNKEDADKRYQYYLDNEKITKDDDYFEDEFDYLVKTAKFN